MTSPDVEVELRPQPAWATILGASRESLTHKLRAAAERLGDNRDYVVVSIGLSRQEALDPEVHSELDFIIQTVGFLRSTEDEADDQDGAPSEPIASVVTGECQFVEARATSPNLALSRLADLIDSLPSGASIRDANLNEEIDVAEESWRVTLYFEPPDASPVVPHRDA